MGYTLPSENSPAERARALMARKDAVEAEIDAQASILKANGATMQTQLVDAQGFPRADIDVLAVRTARVRIIELRNDLSGLTDEIGKALEGVYERTPDTEKDAGQNETREELMPFAKVNGVAPGSPAADAVSGARVLLDRPFLIVFLCVYRRCCATT
ncbi:hypothetical protein OF83DRAFT_1104314 [Amylostereum chailletii]|nr:hypothetical protein OF83DRAFT_1104314 [Amylostereum chailletii]